MMDAFSVYQPEFKDQWDAVVRESKNGTFLLLRDYLDYHSDRFVDRSLVFWNKGKAIAVFPCSEHEKTVVSHGGLTYGGLIYGKEVHASTVLSIFQALVSYYRDTGFAELIYKAVPAIFHSYPAEEDLYALFRFQATLYRRDLSSAIDLAKRPKFSDSRKNTARKAPKLGAVFAEIDDMEGFHRLLSVALERFGTAPVHSVAELRLLQSRFPDRIRLFGVMLDGVPIAASLIFDFGDAVHTQYMAASDEGRMHGALDYLLVSLIEKTFSDRRYFSFGVSTEKQGLYLNEGLLRQKEGFGARGIVHDFYRLEL